MNGDDLAATLTTRLDAVAPAGLQVSTDDDQVVVRRGDVVLGGSAAPRILDGSDQEFETAARATISAVQDVIAQELTVPWPAMVGPMPQPNARLSDGVVQAWFGPAADPVLSSASLAITEAGRPAP